MKNASLVSPIEMIPEDSRPVVVATLRQLLEAWQFALGKREEAWAYALTRDDLLGGGNSITVLRCLTREGFLQHRIETTYANSKRRRFRASPSLTFGPRSCFVLTEKGLRLALTITDSEEEVLACKHGGTGNAGGRRKGKPRWDGVKRQLIGGGRLLRTYSPQASNRICLLDAFQEAKWPEWMYDPIPGKGEVDPVQRLRDAVCGLNHDQEPQLLEFRTIHAGTAVAWRWLAPPPDKTDQKRSK